MRFDCNIKNNSRVNLNENTNVPTTEYSSYFPIPGLVKLELHGEVTKDNRGRTIADATLKFTDGSVVHFDKFILKGNTKLTALAA